MSKFIKGMDLSTLLELERCGAKYYEDGKEKDILDIMKEHDVVTIRIRLWNDPKSEDGDCLFICRVYVVVACDGFSDLRVLCLSR